VEHLPHSLSKETPPPAHADATILAREQTSVDNKEQVLPAIGGMVSKLRQKLGESLSSIQHFDVPIEQATTPSLEALRAYSLAIQQRAQGTERQAIPLFEHAIELDPGVQGQPSPESPESL
jgi:hypothetical protein